MMEEKILKAVKDFKLLEKGQNVTVALSGGADSMALLIALDTLKDKLGITLDAAHFNHKIRGDEAESDQNFVIEQCQKRKIKIFIGSADIPEIAREKSLSIELAAREERYAFLKNVGQDVIATAHTLSDNLETVLFNLARGTALKGLCGIPAKRDVFIRPLIYCTRADVEKYCAEKGIPYVTDSTNLCDDYSRNKIRHNIIPVLKDINPAAEDALLRTVTSLNEDSEFLESISEKELRKRLMQDNTLSVKDFSFLHKAVAKRVIAKFYNDRLSVYPDNLHINEIYDICLSGGKTSIARNKSAVVGDNCLEFVDNSDEILPKYQYKVEIVEKNIDYFKNVHDLLLNNTLDCDKIIGKLVSRTRLPGDRIYLRRSNGTKTLKKLYTEYSVPLSERSLWPVLADDKGIVWVNGMDVAKRCAVTPDTKRVLCIETKIK